jgi:hypothetical protein
MQIRNLFEALGKEAAIIFGRFNPAHKGHRAAWEQAKKSPIWYVGTNRTTVGPKDPLPFDVKIEVMKTIMPEIDGHILAETSWFTMASSVYEKHGDGITLYVVTDKTDKEWIMPTMIRQNGQQGDHGYYNFKNIEWREAPRLSSATDLRGAVDSGDRDAFSLAAGVSAETLVMGKPFFDLVAEYLIPEQEKEQARQAAIAAKKANAAAKKAAIAAKRAAKTNTATAESLDVDEASLSTMRDYFAGDKNARDTSKIAQMRLHFSKASDAAKPTARKEFKSEWEYQQWLNKNKLKRAEPSMAENFADGKNPQDKGDSARHGIPKKASVSSLRKIAKQGGRKGQLAHWQANMKAGREKNESTERESFEEARMSAAAKLGKAWDAQKAKSDASRQRAKDLLNPPKPEPKKTNETAGVGIITKQNTTVDVNKNTPRKNLKAFRLVK